MCVTPKSDEKTVMLFTRSMRLDAEWTSIGILADVRHAKLSIEIRDVHGNSAIKSYLHAKTFKPRFRDERPT